MPRRPIAVVGPTCTGKTTLAVRLAELLAPAELVNADSRQVLQELHVATCAPSASELRGVPCHLLDLVQPGEAFTVAQWAAAARSTLRLIAARGAWPILVGGTGLYITALEEGFDFGSTAPGARREERSRQARSAAGLAALGSELRARDPAGAGRVDLRNPRRVVRALEILDEHPDGLAVARGRRDPVPLLKVGLDLAEPLLRARVRERAETMFLSGRLLDEARNARERGYKDPVIAASGIGYREAIEVLDGRSEPEAAITATAARTLRYAKAQRTYWRRDPAISWHDAARLDLGALVADLRGGERHPAADLPRL
jgi:tRNA dimethylallyltransferase